MTDYRYEGVRRLVYGEGATFVPVCAGIDGKGGCGRFVKADADVVVFASGLPAAETNATCSRCGRVQMLFEGYL